jgi:hypothetical protein
MCISNVQNAIEKQSQLTQMVWFDRGGSIISLKCISSFSKYQETTYGVGASKYWSSMHYAVLLVNEYQSVFSYLCYTSGRSTDLNFTKIS